MSHTGVNESINATGGPGVYSSGHRLLFYPTVREADQGYYYCCNPEGDACSDLTDVRISGEYNYVATYIASYTYVAA